MTVYSPSFVSANSTTGIPNFTNRNGTMGILSNTAYPVAATFCFASWDTVLGSDDMDVAVTMAAAGGTGALPAFLVLGASTAGEAMVLVISPGTLELRTMTDWTYQFTSTSRASGSVTWTTGDVIKVGRVGNVYTVYKNGTTTGITWTDSGSALPRNSSHRLIGVGGYNDSGNYNRFSALTANDTANDTAAFFALF